MTKILKKKTKQPLLPPEGLEPDVDLPGAHPGVPGVPILRTTSLLAIGALLRELPTIIEKAAACKDLWTGSGPTRSVDGSVSIVCIKDVGNFWLGMLTTTVLK